MSSTRHPRVPLTGTDHKAQLDRLSRIEGQVRGIRKMIEEERYCVDVLLQVRSALRALSRVQENIFRGHLEACVQDSLSGNDRAGKKEKVDEIIDLVSRFSRE